MDYQHFEHPDFELDVPADWLSVPSPIFEAVFVMPPFPDGPGINICVSITKGAEPTTFEAVVSGLRTVQADQYPHFQLHDEHMLEFPNQNGFGQFYTWQNPDTQVEIAQSQIIFIAESHLEVAVLTFTRPVQTDPTDVKILDTVFYDVASSFVFTTLI